MTREELRVLITAQDLSSAAFVSARKNVAMLQSGFAALGGSAIVSAIRRGVKSLDDIGDSAERLGTSAVTLQALRFQIGQSGGDAELAERAFDKFSDSIVEAANGSNFLTRFLQTNGQSLRDATGAMKSFDDALVTTARLVSGLASPQEKLKVATDLFGRQAGPKMVGTLEQIAQRGLPAVVAAAKEAGQALDEGLINRAGKLDDRFKQMETAISNRLKSIAVQLAPFVQGGLVLVEKGIEGVQSGIDALRVTGTARALQLGFGGAIKSATDLAEAIALIRSQGDPIKPEWIKRLKELQDAEEEASKSALKITVSPTNMPLHEEFETATKAIEKRTLAMEIDTVTLGKEAGATAQLRSEMELIEVLEKNGIELNERYASAIEKVAQKAGIAAAAQQKAKMAFEGVNEAARFAGNQAVTIIEDLFDRTKKKSDIAINALRAFTNQLLQAMITGEGAFAKIMGTASTTGGVGGLVGSAIKAFSGSSGGGSVGIGDFAGKMADGGFIPPGKWGWTGEEGPEPIFGGRTGVTVQPNGGASPITVHVDARGAAPGEGARFEMVAHGLARQIADLRKGVERAAYHAETGVSMG